MNETNSKNIRIFKTDLGSDIKDRPIKSYDCIVNGNKRRIIFNGDFFSYGGTVSENTAYKQLRNYLVEIFLNWESFYNPDSDFHSPETGLLLACENSVYLRDMNKKITSELFLMFSVELNGINGKFQQIQMKVKSNYMSDYGVW